MLRVGDLARLSGKTVRAIRLYEELGLLRPASRSSGGFRLYEPRAVERVRWIELLHGMGFSLHEMKDVLRGWWRSELGPEAMSRLRSLFQAKLAETRRAIERHRQIEVELEAGLAYLETCKVCPTLESVNGCVKCPQDHGMEKEPALLAGLMSEPQGRERRPRAARPGAGFVRLEEIGRRE
jgi:DNA-binding transcriptional MerR regulator